MLHIHVNRVVWCNWKFVYWERLCSLREGSNSLLTNRAHIAAVLGACVSEQRDCGVVLRMYATTIPVDHTSYHATNHTKNRAVEGKSRLGDRMTSKAE